MKDYSEFYRARHLIGEILHKDFITNSRRFISKYLFVFGKLRFYIFPQFILCHISDYNIKTKFTTTKKIEAFAIDIIFDFLYYNIHAIKCVWFLSSAGRASDC